MTSQPVPFEVAEKVATISKWHDNVAELMTSQAGRRLLQKACKDAVRQGAVSLFRMIEMAEGGHEDADWALRELAVEQIDSGQFGTEASAALRTYVGKALLRPPVTYPGGTNVADFWVRNIAIAVMVDLTCTRWNLKPTRSSARRLSGSYLVSIVLNDRAHPMTEKQVERIHRDHFRLAANLAASLRAV